MPAVLKCFGEGESRVRYYACESMFNIVKVARGHILKYFNVMFIGLCKLFADVDVDVKNAAVFLDRLLKDIATESASFDVDRFIPLLQDHMKASNPWVRALLVGWITVLDSVPDIEMVDWLPDFLEGLFDMLSDGNREIRQVRWRLCCLSRRRTVPRCPPHPPLCSKHTLRWLGFWTPSIASRLRTLIAAWHSNPSFAFWLASAFARRSSTALQPCGGCTSSSSWAARSLSPCTPSC